MINFFILNRAQNAKRLPTSEKASVIQCFLKFTTIAVFLVAPIQLTSYHNPQTKIVERSLKKNITRLSPNSLNRYGKSIYSQYGEDGIIEEIFTRIGIDSGFFVDFGANDGIWLSNTRLLWEKGWNGVMIEANPKFYKTLRNTYENDPQVKTLNEFVTWKKDDKRGRLFNEIKEEHFKNQEIDFLSIDIDGGDYFILKTLKCRPKVICIENGLKWHPLMKKEAPESIALKNIHQPLEVVIGYAKTIGYRAVCSTNNLFLVREDFSHLFENVPDDAITIFRDAFRALPNKKWWLYWRVQPIITSFEGPEFQKLMPITMEF
ncbi:MAG: hypothetical protein ChlgKO_05370 [Chlamydiales bacterium]